MSGHVSEFEVTICSWCFAEGHMALECEKKQRADLEYDFMLQLRQASSCRCGADGFAPLCAPTCERQKFTVAEYKRTQCHPKKLGGPPLAGEGIGP